MNAWSKALWPLAVAARDPLLCLWAELVFLVLRCGGWYRKYFIALPPCLLLLAGQRYPGELARLLLPSPQQPCPGYRGWLFLTQRIAPAAPFWQWRLLLAGGAGICALLCLPWLTDIVEYTARRQRGGPARRLLLAASFLGFAATAIAAGWAFSSALAARPLPALLELPNEFPRMLPECLSLFLALLLLLRNAAPGGELLLRGARRACALASVLLLAAVCAVRDPWGLRTLPDLLLFLNLLPCLPPFRWEDGAPGWNGMLQRETEEEYYALRHTWAHLAQAFRGLRLDWTLPSQLCRLLGELILEEDDRMGETAADRPEENPAQASPNAVADEPEHRHECILQPGHGLPPPPPGHVWAQDESVQDPNDPFRYWL